MAMIGSRPRHDLAKPGASNELYGTDVRPHTDLLATHALYTISHTALTRWQLGHWNINSIQAGSYWGLWDPKHHSFGAHLKIII